MPSRSTKRLWSRKTIRGEPLGERDDACGIMSDYIINLGVSETFLAKTGEYILQDVSVAVASISYQPVFGKDIVGYYYTVAVTFVY